MMDEVYSQGGDSTEKGLPKRESCMSNPPNVKWLKSFLGKYVGIILNQYHTYLEKKREKKVL